MAQYLPEFNQKYRPTFPVGHMNRDLMLGYLQHPVMERFMVPQMVVIDRKFNIRHQIKSGDQFFSDADRSIRAVIEPLLSEAAAGRTKSGARSRKK